MEFCEGASVRDPAALRALGASPRHIAALVAAVFDEMIFHFGDVHCDPHAANMLVRRGGDGSGPVQLVLLDHGLYRCGLRPQRLTMRMHDRHACAPVTQAVRSARFRAKQLPVWLYALCLSTGYSWHACADPAPPPQYLHLAVL